MKPMKPRRRFRPLSLLAALGLTLVITSGACSRNGEGERCDFEKGGLDNSDCEGGLACISSDVLRNSGGVDRCCPPGDNEPISDERCERGTPSGAGGTGGSTADAGDGGGAAGQSGAAGLGGAAGQPGVDAGNDASDASTGGVDGQAGGAGADGGAGAPADASSG